MRHAPRIRHAPSDDNAAHIPGGARASPLHAVWVNPIASVSPLVASAGMSSGSGLAAGAWAPQAGGQAPRGASGPPEHAKVDADQ